MSAPIQNRSRPRKPRRIGCPDCEFTGRVFSQTLARQIRCPKCNRQPRQNRSGIKALTSAERQRMQEILQQSALTVAREEALVAQLPTDLLTTDRILQRWAVGHGSGLPFSDEELEEIVEAAQEQSDTFEQEQAKPPRLDDATQTVVDQIIGPDPDKRIPRSLLHSDPGARAYRARRLAERLIPTKTARFVWQWYCKPTPCTIISIEHGVDESHLEGLWCGSLYEVRTRFVGSGHEDLVAMVRVLA